MSKPTQFQVNCRDINDLDNVFLYSTENRMSINSLSRFVKSQIRMKCFRHMGVCIFIRAKKNNTKLGVDLFISKMCTYEAFNTRICNSLI